MSTCVECGQTLVRKQSEYGIFWACEGCGRWLLGIPILRNLLEPEFFTRFWQDLRNSPEGLGKACPACAKPMTLLNLGTPEAPLDPLICKNCNNAWFNPAERALLPIKPSLQAAPAPTKALPPNAAQLAAIFEAQMIAERAKNENKFDASRIPLWQKALCVVGMPLEDVGLDRPPLPRATLLLLAAILLFGFNFLSDGTTNLVSQFAFVPSDLGRNGGMPLLLNFLVGSGWFQLASDAYFLYLLGRSVEAKIQWGGFLALFLASNLAGNLAAYCLVPHSHAPIQGAGAGVAGLLLFYGFVFPHKRLVFYFFRRFIPIPAWAFLSLWVFFQMMGAIMQTTAAGGVSYACNFGGLLVGLAGWFLWRRKNKVAPPPDVGPA